MTDKNYTDIDVLEPSGSRKKYEGYKEMANAEASDFYNLKEHILEHLNIGSAAIENEKDCQEEWRKWRKIKVKIEALIRDIEVNC
jgi:hypothetical protein